MCGNNAFSLGSRWAVAGQSPANRRGHFSDYFRVFFSIFGLFRIISRMAPTVKNERLGGHRRYRPMPMSAFDIKIIGIF